MRVLFAVSELAPWVKTGGLGDVAFALPEALFDAGLDVRVLVPSYPALRVAFPGAPIVATLPPLDGFGHGAAIREARTAFGMVLYLLECHAFYDRYGHPYMAGHGHDWPDNALRFGYLARVAALLASTDSPLPWQPQILHCNDWQTALAPAYLHYRHAGHDCAHSVMGVHNLAYQGRYDRSLLAPLGLPEHAWRFDSVEHHGALSYLKAGLQHADVIATVSPTYAREIQTAEGGAGLDGLLRHRAGSLRGILNGIETHIWNPAEDSYLSPPYLRYDAATLARKKTNTAALRTQLGLAPRPDLPLLGIVSRMTAQKGLDLVLQLAEALAALPVQLAVIGSGERAMEDEFMSLASRWPGQFAVHIGYNEALAHRIEAGADLFLMPSRFEPCGLNQMYSLHYGTPPIVRATGGLADTVIDASDDTCGTGFVFHEPTADALFHAIERACALWRDKRRFARLQRRGASADFSWAQPAREYIALYESLN